MPESFTVEVKPPKHADTIANSLRERLNEHLPAEVKVEEGNVLITPTEEDGRAIVQDAVFGVQQDIALDPLDMYKGVTLKLL